MGFYFVDKRQLRSTATLILCGAIQQYPGTRRRIRGLEEETCQANLTAYDTRTTPALGLHCGDSAATIRGGGSDDLRYHNGGGRTKESLLHGGYHDRRRRRRLQRRTAGERVLVLLLLLLLMDENLLASALWKHYTLSGLLLLVLGAGDGRLSIDARSALVTRLSFVPC